MILERIYDLEPKETLGPVGSKTPGLTSPYQLVDVTADEMCRFQDTTAAPGWERGENA